MIEGAQREDAVCGESLIRRREKPGSSDIDVDGDRPRRIAYCRRLDDVDLVFKRAGGASVPDAIISRQTLGAGRYDQNFRARLRERARDLGKLGIVADCDADFRAADIEDAKAGAGADAPFLALETCHDMFLLEA